MVERRVRAYASGRVQGVLYRDTTKRAADSVQAKGWVRNLPDGRVEALIEGTDDQVNMVLNFMEVGPSRAYVDSLEVIEEDYVGEFKDFQVRYDY